MSATNRGSKRAVSDFYATPHEALDSIIPILPRTPAFYDPCEGDGRIVTKLIESGRFAGGSDLCPQGKPFAQPIDFLTLNRNFQFIITNPPFSLAQEFITHSLDRADETMMLLRLNFLGSKKRKEWWKQNEPNAIFVLSARPDFTGAGGDACEYGWFYWGFRYSGIHHL